jgi:molybdopterin synthase sulfur carrier subunit
MSVSGTAETRVLFFASLREVTGTDELLVSLAEPISVDGLLSRLSDRLSESAMTALRAENVRLAINQTLLNGPATIRPGDEVAFMPPVTGG